MGSRLARELLTIDVSKLEQATRTDLVWLAVDEQGRALIHQGRVEEGLGLVDEALIAATAGELSPPVTGIVYCNTIAFCQSMPMPCATTNRSPRAAALAAVAYPLS